MHSYINNCHQFQMIQFISFSDQFPTTTGTSDNHTNEAVTDDLTKNSLKRSKCSAASLKSFSADAAPEITFVTEPQQPQLANGTVPAATNSRLSIAEQWLHRNQSLQWSNIGPRSITQNRLPVPPFNKSHPHDFGFRRRNGWQFPWFEFS